MAKITAPKIESAPSTFTAKQPVRIPKGLYGMMFSWYSLPKEYRKYSPPGAPASNETEVRFYVGFTVTHDKMNRQLPAFSSVTWGIRPTLFHSATSGMTSSYAKLLYALLGGKKSLEQIAEMSDNETPDLDILIGRPVIGFIEESHTPDRNGVYSNRLKGIEPPDRDFMAAVRGLYESKVVEVGEKGTVRLVIPPVEYQEIGTPVANGAVEPYDDLNDEVPF